MVCVEPRIGEGDRVLKHPGPRNVDNYLVGIAYPAREHPAVQR